MKKLLLFALIATSFNSFSQSSGNDDYPSPSLGILGAANFSTFKIEKGNAEYKFGLGYSAGAWVNFPLGKVVSLEPQVLYSVYKYKPKSGAINPDFKGTLNYISLPVLLKFNLTKFLAITAGPQFDFLSSQKKDNKYTIDSFAKSSTYVTGGVEIFPRGRLKVFGRYLHGLTDIDHGTVSPTPSPLKIKNRHIQVGLKFGLVGGRKSVPPPPAPAPPPPPPPPAPEPVKEVDTDGDGINDKDDKCPNEAGTAKYQGCPVPDTDGDGFNDEVDKCPNVAGVKEYDGCPIPDTDGDGILDPEDKCPTIAGVKENDGCPAIPKLNAANVQFVTGSSKLTPGALKELDDIVSYMKEYPEVSLQVNGHTDNVGKEALNQTLSEKRAASVVAALVKKGVDASKLTSAGFGMSQPIADNKTAAGRTKNRRVEFKFSQSK